MARQILGKVVPTGEDTYDNNRTYDELCIVMYNGQSYISKKETRGNKPDNTEYWQQLVEKPVKGADYFTEADKDEIVNDVTNDATNKYNQAVATGIDTFNQNAERKTSDFNDNASEKTDTYNANADSTTQAFTNNANSKTEAYNTNATEKLDTYNSNHTAKLKEYNDNATSKLSAYNTNTVTKTTEYNSNHTNKLSAYDTNASNKVDAYNTNADARLEEYNTNANNKIAEYDEHSKELNNKIVSTRNELERLKSNVLNTGEDTDTFIHLEDSAMAEMQEIKVDGVCEQNTTSGKNILQNNATSKTENGITFTKNDDGTITVNGTATATSSINLYRDNLSLRKGNYILNGCPRGGGSSNYRLAMNKGSNTSNFFDTGSGVNVNLEADITNAAVWIAIYQGVTVNNLVFKPMIRLASITDDTYEPYTGGQPSPNPDYPQEIKTITGNLKLTSCGKNLFNGTDYSMIVNGVTISISRNRITLNGTATGAYNNSNSNYINAFPIKLAEIYSYSCTQVHGSMTGTRLAINLRGGNNTTDMSKQFNPASLELKNGSNSTSNSRIDCSYITGLQFIFSDDAVFDNYTFDIQLEQGRNVTPYEDYIESQIQAKLPEGEFIGKLDETHKDTLRTEYFPEEGQYHRMLDKKIGKHVFTGDEDFTIRNSSSGITQIRYSNSKIAKLSDSNYVRAISNYFTHNYSWGNSWNKDNSLAHWVGFSAIVFYSSNFSTVSDFKQFLKDKYDNGNPVVVYYLLAKPYTLDLGVIDMPMSYKDITNIFTDSDLLPTINAKYYRVFDKTIQNAQINEKTLKQEITDLNATVSALDTRLKALETKTVEEPTESEGTV